MKIYTILSLGFVSALLTIPACAQHVSISSGGHTKIATEQSVTYRGVCGDVAYEAQFDREKKKLLMKIGANAANIKDLTNSPFGQTFLNGRLFGKFGLGCSTEGLQMYFVGYQAVSKDSPKAVSYTVTIDSSGEIIGDSGLQDERESLPENRAVGQ